ncbi:MAG: YraN family protein [Clostridia bacterium]|nr:YraN family protein [Clostridia bacterium]
MVINKSGVWGELYAARYLRDNGYKIIAGNYRRRVGEIDIIAQKDNTVCFVEVKTRGEDPMFAPSEAVDALKQEKIRATAGLFMNKFGGENNVRFDVVEVILDKNFNKLSLNHIKDAF